MAHHDDHNPINWPALACQVGYRVCEFAMKLGLSTRQLERQTHELFQCSPKDWLDNCQMKQAAALLKGPGPVKVVALDLGFKQASHFSKKFKRAYGVTPVAFMLRSKCEGNRQVIGADSDCDPPVSCAYYSDLNVAFR